MPPLEDGTLAGRRDPTEPPNHAMREWWPFGALRLALPSPLPSPPTPAPPSSCTLGSPEAPSILHPSFGAKQGPRGSRSVKAEGGRPSRLLEASSASKTRRGQCSAERLWTSRWFPWLGTYNLIFFFSHVEKMPWPPARL